jgi:chromosome segregation ATPase
MENIEEKTNDTPKPVRQTPAWLRGFLRWGLVILIAFALGAALIALVFHLPLQQDYKRVSSELESASAEITDLTGQLSELTATNESLQQNLDGATLQQSIFNALAEVRAARLAIAANDPAGARLAVTQAIQSLDTLAGLIDKEHSDIVGNMLEKATQANIDLQTDMAVALPALEQLDTNLVSLIQTLFP